jgi:predicted lipid-binding transport protein (Tim44 family)
MSDTSRPASRSLIPQRLRAKSLVPKPKPGYTDALSTSLTFVLGPLLFGLFGAFLDGLFGTGRVFTVLLAVIGLISVATTIYYRYQAASAAEDAGKPWEKRTNGGSGSQPQEKAPELR